MLCILRSEVVVRFFIFFGIYNLDICILLVWQPIKRRIEHHINFLSSLDCTLLSILSITSNRCTYNYIPSQPKYFIVAQYTFSIHSCTFLCILHKFHVILAVTSMFPSVSTHITYAHLNERMWFYNCCHSNPNRTSSSNITNSTPTMLSNLNFIFSDITTHMELLNRFPRCD